MTLCIAALCIDDEDVERSRIVVCSDNRAELGIASADNILKYEVLGPGLWAMFADNISRAREFAATCRETLKLSQDVPLTRDSLQRQLNEASAAYRAKLYEQEAQRRFARSYERVLAQGANEILIPETNRVRFFNDLERLRFECELLIFGFMEGKGEIFCVDQYGKVEHESNFAAIGNGATIAEANLCFRKQIITHHVEFTLYNVYESARLAYEALAPGVGETLLYMVLGPRADGRFDGVKLSSTGLTYLDRLWRKFGPKKFKTMSAFDADHFEVFVQPPFGKKKGKK